MTEYGYIYGADFDEKRVCIFDIISSRPDYHYDHDYNVFDTFTQSGGGYKGKQYLYHETDDRKWYCGLDDAIPAERL